MTLFPLLLAHPLKDFQSYSLHSHNYDICYRALYNPSQLLQEFCHLQDVSLYNSWYHKSSLYKLSSNHLFYYALKHLQEYKHVILDLQLISLLFLYQQIRHFHILLIIRFCSLVLSLLLLLLLLFHHNFLLLALDFVQMLEIHLRHVIFIHQKALVAANVFWKD